MWFERVKKGCAISHEVSSEVSHKVLWGRSQEVGGFRHEVWCVRRCHAVWSKEMPCSLELRAGVRKRRPAGKPAWSRQWQSRWSCTGTYLTKHGLVGDAWNAELWPGMLCCRFLPFWEIVPPTGVFWNWPRFSRGATGLCVWGYFKVGLNGRNLPLFWICITCK